MQVINGERERHKEFKIYSSRPGQITSPDTETNAFETASFAASLSRFSFVTRQTWKIFPAPATMISIKKVGILKRGYKYGF